MEPILKWVGSKRWQVESLRPYWRGERVVELFCGSAAMSFGWEPERALLNDANPHLTNFYRHVRTFDVLDFTGCTSEKEYYRRRDRFNQLVRDGRADSATAAGLFYYLNCTAFNNLWRVNGAGEFNVPFRKGRENVSPLGALPNMTLWQFTNDDFRDVLLEPDDFVYADPPYLETFEDYTAEGFSVSDFADLVALLTGHPGRVVIMNSATDEAIHICQNAGFYCTLLESRQKMQYSRGRNDVVSELMAANFPLTDAV